MGAYPSCGGCGSNRGLPSAGDVWARCFFLSALMEKKPMTNAKVTPARTKYHHATQWLLSAQKEPAGQYVLAEGLQQSQ